MLKAVNMNYATYACDCCRATFSAALRPAGRPDYCRLCEAAFERFMLKLSEGLLRLVRDIKRGP